jgi:hypothetical protein
MFQSIHERSNKVEVKVTRVMGSLTLIAPVNYRASVLLKLVGINTVKNERVYVVWVVAGRDEADSVAVNYAYTGEDVLRVDVPAAAPLTTDYLDKVLRGWKDPMLPTETPVVKGVI